MKDGFILFYDEKAHSVGAMQGSPQTPALRF
jgi:hypothetical protein